MSFEEYSEKLLLLVAKVPALDREKHLMEVANGLNGTHTQVPVKEPIQLNCTDNPSSLRTKGRPKGSLGKKTLKRDPSSFEYSLPPKKRGRPRGVKVSKNCYILF